MLAEQRRSVILETLSEQGAVSVAELYRKLGVSRETIRRDISRLDQESRLRKTHGGAMSLGREPAFAQRKSINVEAKRSIGRVAAALVPDGASVIVDSGTTIQELVEALADKRHLRVITNDLQAATELSGRNDNSVLILGGELIAGEGAIMGRDVTAMLGNYFADFAFVGAGAISSHPWLMDFSREAAEIRGQMLALARFPVVLADHTKFDRIAPNRVANFDKASHIVVDRKPEGAFAAVLASHGAKILVAEDNE